MKEIKEEVKEEVKEEPVEEETKEVKEEVSGEAEYYVLRHGDDLKEVAKKFKTTVKKLEELNGDATFIATNQIRVK